MNPTHSLELVPQGTIVSIVIDGRHRGQIFRHRAKDWVWDMPRMEPAQMPPAALREIVFTLSALQRRCTDGATPAQAIREHFVTAPTTVSFNIP